MTRNSSARATQKSGPRALEGPQKPRSPQGGKEGVEGKPRRRRFSEPETRAGGGSGQTPGLRPGRAEEPPAAPDCAPAPGSRTSAGRAAPTLGGPCRSRLQGPGRVQRVRSPVTWWPGPRSDLRAENSAARHPGIRSFGGLGAARCGVPVGFETASSRCRRWPEGAELGSQLGPSAVRTPPPLRTRNKTAPRASTATPHPSSLNPNSRPSPYVEGVGFLFGSKI